MSAPLVRVACRTCDEAVLVSVEGIDPNDIDFCPFCGSGRVDVESVEPDGRDSDLLGETDGEWDPQGMDDFG